MGKLSENALYPQEKDLLNCPNKKVKQNANGDLIQPNNEDVSMETEEDAA